VAEGPNMPVLRCIQAPVAVSRLLIDLDSSNDALLEFCLEAIRI
jgi:hypothetical protein